MALYSAQDIGTGNTSDGFTILDVGQDHYKGYESSSNGYLFLAGFDNIVIEFRAKSKEQANDFLHKLGYPE